MDENTWYSMGPYEYILLFDNLYIIYWIDNISMHISIVDDPRDWATGTLNAFPDRFPDWKRNLFKALFGEDVVSEAKYDIHIRSFNKYWNWGN